MKVLYVVQYGVTIFKYSWLHTIYKYNRKHNRKLKTLPIRFSLTGRNAISPRLLPNRFPTLNYFLEKNLTCNCFCGLDFESRLAVIIVGYQYEQWAFVTLCGQAELVRP